MLLRTSMPRRPAPAPKRRRTGKLVTLRPSKTAPRPAIPSPMRSRRSAPQPINPTPAAPTRSRVPGAQFSWSNSGLGTCRLAPPCSAGTFSELWWISRWSSTASAPGTRSTSRTIWCCSDASTGPRSSTRLSQANTSIAPGCEQTRPTRERTRSIKTSSCTGPRQANSACQSPRDRFFRSRDDLPAKSAASCASCADLCTTSARRRAPPRRSRKRAAPTPRTNPVIPMVRVFTESSAMDGNVDICAPLRRSARRGPCRPTGCPVAAAEGGLATVSWYCTPLIEYSRLDARRERRDRFLHVARYVLVEIHHQIADVRISGENLRLDVRPLLAHDAVDVAQDAWDVAVRVEDAVRAPRLGHLDLGKVDRAGGRARVDELDQAGGGLAADGFPPLDGRARD